MILDRTLALITIVGWIALGLIAVLFLLRTAMRQGLGAAIRALFSMRFLLFILIPLLMITFLSEALVFVQPQEISVVVSLFSPNGYREAPLRSGLHWILPLAEEVHIYPISWQTYTMSAKPMEGNNKGDDSIRTRTSDGQEVSIDCSVIFHLDPEQVTRVHVNWQDRYIDDFIRPLVRGMVRTLVSQYTVDEVNSSKRLDIEKNLNDNLSKVFAQNGFSLDYFLLRNISFSDEYAASVEAKQVALQGKFEKEHIAEQVRKESQGQADKIRIEAQAEADAIRLKAQAEADALRLLAEALKLNPDLVTLRYVDKLAPGIQVMLVPNNAPYILPIPTMGAQTGGEVSSPTPLPTLTPMPTEAEPTPLPEP